MSYHCNDCGEDFDELGTCAEERGECFGLPAYEDCDCCPYCESDDFCENVECSECGNSFPEDDEEKIITNIGRECLNLCTDCQSKVQKKFAAFLESLSEVEKDYLIENFDDFIGD